MSEKYRDVLDLHNKNAVITGASSGIGKEVALTLAKEGYNILLQYSFFDMYSSF